MLISEKKIDPHDSLTLTSTNQNAYMVTPLEDMEPPCEQKALVWNTSLQEIQGILKVVIQHVVESIEIHSQHFTRCPQRNDGFPEMNCNL